MPSLDRAPSSLVAPAPDSLPSPSTATGPFAAATLATLNSSAFRERMLPLLAMVSLTTSEEETAAEERAARLELTAAGWQRIDGDGNSILLDAVVNASSARPELYLLPTARLGVFSFRGLSKDNPLQDLCASECKLILAPRSLRARRDC